MQQKIYKAFFSFFTILFLLGWLAPAQAFYLEVPKRVNESFNNLKMSPRVLGETVSANSNDSASAQPPQTTFQSPIQQETKTCNVNGVEMQGPCENYNSDSGGQSSQPQPQNNDRNDEQRQKQDEERQKKDDERQKKDQERWINDMRRGSKDMERNITRLSNMFKKAEKDGTVIPQDIKDQLTKANEIIKSINAAQTAEEMQNIAMQDLNDIMRNLEEARMVLIDQAQQLKDMKRGLKDMTKELARFEKQVEKLKKQKMAIPEELSETLGKIKSTVAAIQNAKTWEEAQAAGIEDMRDLWDALNENRRTLEMLSRWPQTLKEIDKQLKQIDKELARAKKTTEKAKKNGMDFSDVYAEFEDAVNKLKSAKGVALKKMADGEGEEAFEIIQNDFFDQMDDTWEHQRIISTLNNLGRFKSEFKKGLNELNALMKKLKRKKIDIAEIEKLIVYAAARGKEIETLLKAKPIDADKIIDLLYELEDLRQEFYDKTDELTGGGETMPWEKGTALFTTPALPDSVSKLIPQKTQPVENMEPQKQENINTAEPQKIEGNEPG
ncbi:MAG: hypothetical protein V1655_00330 [bacterium]